MLSLDLDALDLNLDFSKLATPEQVRRSGMSNISSATRSIDVPRGILSKGSTSLGGPESELVVTQFGANDEDMAYFGFNDDDYGFFLPSGPEDPSSGLESYKRASMQDGNDLNIPLEIQVVPKSKKPTTSKMFDDETQLNKDQLLLNEGEGIINGSSYGADAKHGFDKIFKNSLLADTCLEELWKSPEFRNPLKRPSLKNVKVMETVGSSDHVYRKVSSDKVIFSLFRPLMMITGSWLRNLMG